MLCTNASVSPGTPPVSESWHIWCKRQGIKVCGDVSWSEAGNEDIFIKVIVYNSKSTTETIIIRVDWNETQNGNTTNHYIENSVAVGTLDTTLSFFDSTISGPRRYQPNTKYEITKVTINGVIQTPILPDMTCSMLTVGTDIVTPTVTITDVTFAYETSPGVCVPINTTCNETMQTLDGKRVAVLCKIICSKKAAFNLIVFYTGPSGPSMIPVSIIQNVDTLSYCIIDTTNIGLWQVGNYSGLTVTAIDIAPG